MTVYVDNLRAPFGRMLMSHMLADTSAELETMARTIGLKPEWIQDAGTHREHYDVSVRHRELAIAHGAQAVGVRVLGSLIRDKRELARGK